MGRVRTMKFLLLLFVSGVLAASTNREDRVRQLAREMTDNVDLTEDEFLEEFHLPPVQDPEEKARRAEALQQHQQEVLETNEAYIAGEKTWYDAINEFSDIPDDEFVRTHTGLADSDHPVDERSERFFEAYRYRRQNVPDSYNSVSLGNVSPVKNQGSCGSCVAFATIAVVETCFKRTVGTFGDYSEQHLLDCAYNGEDQWISGCNGAWNPGYAYWLNGYWPESHNHTFSGHFASESEYPYNAERGECRTDYQPFYQGAKISGLYYTGRGDEETMKALVAEHGAVQTTVGANSGFGQYKGGVFAGCTGSSTNHAVVVVGYGTENGVDYWLVKNSWSKRWGDNGYIKIQRGVGMCGIGKSHVVLTCEQGDEPVPEPEETHEIQSPNYPNVYPHNLDETWNLEVAAGQNIRLTFESFNLESHSNCSYDYVQISDGMVEEKYCGSDKPSPIKSSGNTMNITFHSDYSVSRKGFKATWEAVENSGEIQSPNYPDKYPHNVNETWNLEVEAGHRIKLTFEAFNLESHSTCKYDFVQISEGSEEEKYCGKVKPSPIISSGNTMNVTFHSDRSVNRSGFKASWEAVTE